MFTVFADALRNLRDSLDHAACGSVFALTGVMRKDTYFPFGDSADKFELRAKKVCKKVASEVLDHIRSLQPHPGGNSPNLLWNLNRLAQPNKHRMLSPIIAHSGGMVRVHSFDGFLREGMPSGWWGPQQKRTPGRNYSTGHEA
jgi:hypothetical protein